MRSRIDPESMQGLDAMLALTGPGGVGAIPDLTARRAKLVEMRVLAQAQQEPFPGEIENRTILSEQIPIRIYRGQTTAAGAPGLLFIHGGGMILGDLDHDDAVARKLTLELGAVTVSVDYRLAPEFPFPAGLEDCYATLRWMADSAADLGFDPQRLVIYGGSAGGALALATTLLARDRGFSGIRFVMAPYPMLDYRNETPSSYEVIDVGVWDRALNIEAWQHYLGPNPVDVSPYASLALAKDLSNLPPLFIDTGDIDLFRDEIITFVQRLMQAGVVVEFHLYPGSFHASEIIVPQAQLSEMIWETRLRAFERALR
ncbi:MAG: alpha/beta hydrolase [Actinomycetales bacterium]|nr:alpha/beta hydrolase [Actinomycetales bacterium]